jgi:LDH2 family malate/lactate/ureidoglycolate dehydrogenase
MAGAYVLRALDAGMVALATGNATAGVPPTGGVEPAVGTNPIAIGAPDGEGRGFLLDMATSVVALGKVEVAQRTGRAIPAGWGLDARGRPTTVAAAGLGGGMLLPLGGPAATGGYKGYGLASAVDILTGVLAGGTFALDVTGLWDTGTPTTSSQLHLVIDPAIGGDRTAFAARLRTWRAQVVARAREPAVPEILVAGDPEWRASARQAERVDVLPDVIRDLATLAVEHRLLRAWRAVVVR